MKFDEMNLAFIGLCTIGAATIIWASVSAAHREPAHGPIPFIASQSLSGDRFGLWTAKACTYGDGEMRCSYAVGHKPFDSKEARK
jgi:hypothetical protein